MIDFGFALRGMLLAVAACSMASAQSATMCTVNGGVPPMVRAEGVAELTGDLVLVCTGPAVTVSLHVFFNTHATSRLLNPATGESEALLLMNEPQPAQLALGANAFHATQCGTSELCWFNITIPAAPAQGTTTLRLTNMRIFAAGLPVSSSLIPSQVIALVSASSTNVVIINPQQVVAFVLNGLNVTNLPSSAGPSVGQTIVPVQFGEGFQTAFKKRLDVTQNPSIPGVVYNTESGFVSTDVLGSSTGLADFPLRLLARIHNIPNGATVYAPVTSNETNAHLISANANGSGGTLITGQPRAGGIYHFLGSSPRTTATWEITVANPQQLETATFNLLVEAPVGTNLSGMNIEGRLVPLSSVLQGESAQFPRFSDPTAVPVHTPGDFNQDGRTDVLWQDPASGVLQAWLMYGTAIPKPFGALNLSRGNSWRIAGADDFNGDSRTDLVWQDPVTGAAQVWFMGGAQGNDVSGSAVLVPSHLWRIAGIADFNSDGKPDIVWQNRTSGAAQVWFMGGAQGTALLGADTLSASNPWLVAGAGDINADGRVDILWQDPLTGAVQVWYLGGTNGSTAVGSATVSAGNPWRIRAVADLNGDGRADLVWQDPITGTSQVWVLGAGETLSVSAHLSGPQSWHVAGPR